MDIGDLAALSALIYSIGMWYMVFKLVGDERLKLNYRDDFVKPIFKILFWPVFIIKKEDD